MNVSNGAPKLTFHPIWGLFGDFLTRFSSTFTQLFFLTYLTLLLSLPYFFSLLSINNTIK